jgi:chromatin structure-remodeling complex subunit RSC1/2
VEDIIEKIACQFTARHIRGRPRPPSWYLGWPLYVCDSRYNDRERIFVKIKNWNSCVPEEVRKSADFMPIYPFERMVFPRRFGSPFLKGTRVRGPGGIGESIDRAEGERIEGGGTGRKRTRKPGAPTDISGPSKGLFVGAGPATVPGATPQPVVYTTAQQANGQPRTEDRSVVTAAGGAAVLGTNADMEKLSGETGTYHCITSFFLRSKLNSGPTARHFDRDPETNEVLWFAAPPLNVARKPAPRYSLQYLHWLATKRKRTEDVEGMDVDGEEVGFKRSATERVEKALMEMEWQ